MSSNSAISDVSLSYGQKVQAVGRKRDTRRIARKFFMSGITAGLFALGNVPANAQSPNGVNPFSWKLTNRFRLLSADDEKRFAKTYPAYLERAQSGKFSYNPLDWQFEDAVFGDKPYKAAWNPAQAQHDLDYVRSQDRAATLTYASAKKCAWVVNGVPVTGNRCKGQAVILKVGSNEVSVSIDGKPLQKLPALVVKDYFAVVLGDSTASGEGNPEVPVKLIPGRGNPVRGPGGAQSRRQPAMWMDERCHRSMISGPLIALFYKSQEDAHRSVTVVDYACSGAEIDNGILDDPIKSRPYQGREVPEQIKEFYRLDPTKAPPYVTDMMLPAQVKVAEEALCLSAKNYATCPRRPPPDAVIIITGANDLSFSDVLMTLIEHCQMAPKGAEPSCFEKQRGDLEAGFERLKEKYSRLHDRVSSWHPRRVLIGGYIDPTRNEDGRYCDDDYSDFMHPHFVPFYMGMPGQLIGIHLGMKKSEFAADRFLKPLNKTLAEVAAKYADDGWVYVNRHTAESARKGICANKRWVIRLQESADKQGILKEVLNPDPKADDKHKTVGGVPSGAMHPNVFGHEHMARALQEKL